VRLSPKTARQRRQSPNSATVALFCDSRCFRPQIVSEIGDSRQCGQTFTNTFFYHCLLMAMCVCHVAATTVPPGRGMAFFCYKCRFTDSYSNTMNSQLLLDILKSRPHWRRSRLFVAGKKLTLTSTFCRLGLRRQCVRAMKPH